MLGVLACLLGLALGDLLSIAVFHATPGYLSFAFPVGNERIVDLAERRACRRVPGWPRRSSGVLWPLRDILHGRCEGDAHPRRRRSGGSGLVSRPALACLAVHDVILLARPQSGLVWLATLVLALVCLLPFALRRRSSLSSSAAQRLLDGAATVLAVTELQTRQTRVRSLAIAATAAVAVFGTVEFQGTQAEPCSAALTPPPATSTRAPTCG